jgi:hypothetical protein
MNRIKDGTYLDKHRMRFSLAEEERKLVGVYQPKDNICVNQCSKLFESRKKGVPPLCTSTVPCFAFDGPPDPSKKFASACNFGAILSHHIRLNKGLHIIKAEEKTDAQRPQISQNML